MTKKQKEKPVWLQKAIKRAFAKGKEFEKEKLLPEAITENQVVADYWEALAYAGRSHVSNLEIDGTQYRFEQIFIEVS